MKYIPDVFGSVIAVERKAWGEKKKEMEPLCDLNIIYQIEWSVYVLVTQMMFADIWHSVC